MYALIYVDMKAHPTWNIMPGILGSGGGFGHKRGLEPETQYHRGYGRDTVVQVY